MICKVILLGRLARDPELRSLPNGQQVANFSVATNRKWKDRDGKTNEDVEFSNVVIFGKQAEIAGQYLAKGSLVYIEGRLQTRSWDDKQSGEKKYRTEVVCENFQMLGEKKASAASGGEGGYGYG